MKNLSLVALFSLLLPGCFIGEKLEGLVDDNDETNCGVDINNDGIIDDSDCQIPEPPGDPSDPCAPNADGTVGANCPPPPPCGCEDPNCHPSCDVDTSNDGIIDDSDCNIDPGDPTDPSDPCSPNADGTIPPNCLPSKCSEDTNGDNFIDDSDCGEPEPCGVDTNNDGLIDEYDCNGEPTNPGDPSDPCSPNADGTVGPNCE